MQIGYMRVSKADGSQTLDLQRDALLAAGIEPTSSMRISPPGAAMTGPVSSPVSRPSVRVIPWWCGSSIALVATFATSSIPCMGSLSAASGSGC